MLTMWKRCLSYLALLSLLYACGAGEPTEVPQAPVQQNDGRFEDVTEALGLPTVSDWPDGRFFLPEIMQGGIAVVDVDRDGDADLVHSRLSPPDDEKHSGLAPQLWLQQSDGRYLEAATAAGLDRPFFGQGIAVGDIDNDGAPDLFFSNYGNDFLYRNRGDGTFEDVTDRSDLSGERWSVGATFCDINTDGWLDLFIVHYVRYDEAAICLDPGGRREYCGPQVFQGEPDRLLLNRGDGTFEDVTDAAQIHLPDGGERARGLGTACADFTGDGLMDLYVANDAESNQLWVNRGDGTFEDQAVSRGVAVNRHGKPEASMGVAVGDVDDDGTLDLFMTHLIQEHNTLFAGSAGPLFFDQTVESGLSADDIESTGFGCTFVDIDRDGDLDLAVANGGVKRHTPARNDALSSFWKDYAERDHLYINDGSGRFRPADTGGDFTNTEEVTRGLVAADLDADGAQDLVVSTVDNRLRIFRNRSDADTGHWLGVCAEREGRADLGAVVSVHVNGKMRRRLVQTVTGYASARPACVYFGLAETAGPPELAVSWTDGSVEKFTTDSVDRIVVLKHGEGLR
jgi:hypothetical protein